MLHKVAVLGSPGTGKSTLGLSYPGVEQHEFGSSESTTALNFVGRTDILSAVCFDWYDTLTEEERAKFSEEKVSELEVALLTKKGRAKNVARYRRYLYQLKNDLLAKKRPELQSVFLDNLTPFAQEFEDYVEMVWAKDFVTKDGNFDTISYYKRFASELTDFIRLFMSLPCHTILSCHVAMLASEEAGANVQFLKTAQAGGVRKEWQPMLTGKVRNVLAGIPDWVFFLKVEENPGQATRYVAKLEADEQNVGVAKPRIQPFINPRQLHFPKNQFYPVFNQALEEYLKIGKPVTNPDGRQVGSG